MDRRTVLAIVLASLVLLVYQFALAPRRTQEPAPDQAIDTPPRSSLSTEPTTPRTTTLGASQTPAASSGAVRNTLLGESPTLVPVEVKEPLFVATVDPAGGVLSGWRLADYTDQQDRAADLVANPSAGLFQLALLTDRGRIDLREIPFLIERSQSDGSDRVTLRTADPSGWSLALEYTFAKDQYSANVEVRTQGLARGADLEIVFPEGLPRLEKTLKQDQQNSATLALLDNRLVKHRGEKRDGWSTSETGTVLWVGARSKYFLTAAIFPAGTPGTYEAQGAGQGHENHVRTSVRIPLGEPGGPPLSFRLFAGPLELNRLEKYEAGLDKAVDLGWKPIVPFSRLLLLCLNFLYSVIPNYGLAILILSIVAKAAFYPLTRKSLKSMRDMQKVKPEMDRINKEYKDDPQAKQKAMLGLYKDHKVNPLGGCLPMVIQMPVFIALYNVLANSVELRKEPFVLWINDLSSPDLIGTVMGLPIHILPLLMAGTMVLQQKLQPMDPRQAAIGYIMPIMMLVFFYMLPSGLVFYWTINNILQVGQQIIVNRETGQQLAAA